MELDDWTKIWRSTDGLHQATWPIVEYEPPKTTGGSNGLKITYIYPEIEGVPPTFQGWQCPKCGRIYSPWKDECWRCNARAERTEMMAKIDLEADETE